MLKKIYNLNITVQVFVTVALIATAAVSEFLSATIIVIIIAVAGDFAIASPTALTAGISNMTRRALLIKCGIFFEHPVARAVMVLSKK